MTNVIISKKKHIRIALYKNYKTFLIVSPIVEPFYDKKKLFLRDQVYWHTKYFSSLTDRQSNSRSVMPLMSSLLVMLLHSPALTLVNIWDKIVAHCMIQLNKLVTYCMIITRTPSIISRKILLISHGLTIILPTNEKSDSLKKKPLDYGARQVRISHLSLI